MPNYCTFNMKAVGKRENVEEFIKVMESDYDYSCMTFGYERHMGGRVFEINSDEIIDLDNCDCEVFMDGTCAWSVYSCMFEGSHTYHEDFKEKYGDKCRSTTVPIESKDLSLDIEIYSEEPGGGFQEHFLVKQGEVILSDCVDFVECDITDFKTKEEAEEELEIEITDSEWASEDYIRRGGFEIWEFLI